MKGRVGRKRHEIDLSKISEIPLHRRTNFRSLAKALGVPKSTTQRLVQQGEIRSHSSVIKPLLTKDNIDKAVARPRFGPRGEVVFDGKIGIFPFTVIEATRRKSKNRDAGVLETKPIASITKEVMKQCLLQEVIPAIKKKWPADDKKTIYIQQDNAKPHIDPADSSFIDAATADGFDIRLTCQPPNNPDLNVLDLGFFRAIQALQYENVPKSVVDLVEVVKSSFEQLQASTLDNVWLSLQYCMHEILKVEGTNAYKLPHVSKQRMVNEGTLPLSISVDASIVQMAIHHLNKESVE